MSEYRNTSSDPELFPCPGLGRRAAGSKLLWIPDVSWWVKKNSSPFFSFHEVFTAVPVLQSPS